ncbi:anthranilate synthase component II [Fluviicola chungangensis]|uniref:Aminodeoxychorismate/anthranilate synthase component II n=1 Tax=Fluviicola chungangensis TaxID=2597671 RepID=A0A556N0X5_9FLAO|nr:aminodeoxychorismate/anthranilate synthase component II [Fluviicola chungangensis]TSJ45826.1 aminodeoxychorismate/anthranilate synthase component II [Fluviicola chungangensis]
MKIAVIDNFDSFVFNLIRYIKEEQHEVIVQRNNRIDFETLESVDAILLSPGPGIPAEAGELLEVINRYHGRKPILGICLGHQAISVYFGNPLIPCPEPVHGKSSQIILTKNSDIFQNLPQRITVGRYHSWQTQIAAESELEVTALTEDAVVMAIQHNVYPTIGVQFHPESILTPHGRKMIQNWLNISL